MVTVMPGSEGNVLGVQMISTIHKGDYAELVPKVEALVQQYDDVRMLCDLGEFKTAAADAWLADLKFGQEFHSKVSKMAIVGDKRWESWVTKLAAPFYAKEAQYFHTADMAAAWSWAKS
jgi:hypothetical protein